MLRTGENAQIQTEAIHQEKQSHSAALEQALSMAVAHLNLCSYCTLGHQLSLYLISHSALSVTLYSSGSSMLRRYVLTVEAGGELEGTGSVLSLCRSPRSNLGCQPWCQLTLPPDPSHQPSTYI